MDEPTLRAAPANTLDELNARIVDLLRWQTRSALRQTQRTTALEERVRKLELRLQLDDEVRQQLRR